MSLSFWIYIIVAIVFAILRQMKKSQAAGEAPRPKQERDQTEGRPMTFEELLREIQASKNPSPPPSPITVTSKTEYKPVKPSFVDYDDDIKNEEENLETTYKTNDSRSFEMYEKAKLEAFKRPSLEETLKLEDTVMKYGHFKGYDETSKSNVAAEVLENFKDPEGFKKAFIMSEILKRKF
jgi:hypothetical protein